MATPLFPFLVKNGTTMYTFPSVAEKISAANGNQNYKMFFSKFALLNFPAQELSVGTNSNPIYFDFLNSAGLGYGFQQSIDATPPSSFGDQVVESLRNYAANMEETMENSKLNATEYFYDNTSITTSAEKIFFKWAKQLNLIDFEPANNGDQYLGNLNDFASNNVSDISYFPEVLWTERNVFAYDIYDMYTMVSGTYSGKLNITFQTTTNFKIGDIVILENETNSTAISAGIFNGKRMTVLSLIPAGALLGQQIILNITPTPFVTNPNNYTGNITLVYNKLVQYIGEVSGVSNNQDNNSAYTSVNTYVPAYNGQTPDVLFRTSVDNNYSPNLVFPILPSQYQPEIVGAENYTSPIVTNPQNYPGSYYGQFDTTDYTYTTSTGDPLRRSGDYYGISGDINNTIVNSANLDGIVIDFDPSHYAKMNIYGREVTNFDQFNALMLNNLPPNNFNFNAMLLWYAFEDINGNIAQDLYGIQFFDNPNNNVNQLEKGIRFPETPKYVATDTQQGTSYDFSTNLNYYVSPETVQDLYNPNAINDVYSFNLWNKVMNLFTTTNESFQNVLAQFITMKIDQSDLKQMVLTNTQYNTIQTQLQYFQKLLQAYSSLQLSSSDTISVNTITSGAVPLIQLNSIDAPYYQVNNILTSNMYNLNGAIPLNVSLPTNKSSLIVIENNDTTLYTLPNNNILSLLINKDLDYKQTLDIVVKSNNISTENKQFAVYINYTGGGSSSVVSTLINTIDLPVYSHGTTLNSAATWDKFNFNIDTTMPLRLNVGSILEIPLDANGSLVYNAINVGDTLVLNNFTIGTASTIDFSGQYNVHLVGVTNSYIYLDISNNTNLVSYGASSSLPLFFNDPTNYLLSNNPYFTLNKGYKFSITRVDPLDSSLINDRYLIEKTTY